MTACPPLIMLVDDDPDFLDMQRHLLEAQGYRVRCCSDAQSALTQMAQNRPNLVITDLMMSTLDAGFALSKKVKDDPRWARVPVIVVTAIASRQRFDFCPRTPADLSAMHADAFFEKPADPDALLAKVRELLGGDIEGDST